MRTSLEVPGEVLLHSICPWNESSVLCAPLLAVKPPSFHLWGNLETRRCSGLLWQRTGPDLVNNTRRGSAEWLTSWFAHSHSTLVLQVCIPGDPSFQVNQDSWLPYLSTEQSQRQTESSSLIRFANESKQLKYNSIKKSAPDTGVPWSSGWVLSSSLESVPGECPHAGPWVLFFQPAHNLDKKGNGKNPKPPVSYGSKDTLQALLLYEEIANAYREGGSSSTNLQALLTQAKQRSQARDGFLYPYDTREQKPTYWNLVDIGKIPTSTFTSL